MGEDKSILETNDDGRASLFAVDIAYFNGYQELANDMKEKILRKEIVMETDNLFDCQDQTVQSLAVTFNILAEHYNQGLFKCVSGRSWINLKRTSESETPHSHPLSIIAGVFYVSVPERSGDIILLSPRQIQPYEMGKPRASCQSFYRITPKAGMFLFFPGYLMHYTEPNFSSLPRISIACNFNLPKEYLKTKQT